MTTTVLTVAASVSGGDALGVLPARNRPQGSFTATTKTPSFDVAVPVPTGNYARGSLVGTDVLSDLFPQRVADPPTVDPQDTALRVRLGLDERQRP